MILGVPYMYFKADRPFSLGYIFLPVTDSFFLTVFLLTLNFGTLGVLFLHQGRLSFAFEVVTVMFCVHFLKPLFVWLASVLSFAECTMGDALNPVTRAVPEKNVSAWLDGKVHRV